MPRIRPGSFTATLDGLDVAPSFTPPVPGGASTAQVPSPCLSGGTQTTSLSPFTHTLRVTGDFSPVQAFDTHNSEVQFTAPSIELRVPNAPPGSLVPAVRVRETHTVDPEVLVPSAPPSPLTVTISVDNNRVVLNGQPAGSSTTVTIPNTDRRTNFTVHGIQQGPFMLTICAPGYQAVHRSGAVLP